MKESCDYIGRIEANSRSASQVDCADCERGISDDALAFVYVDLNGALPGGVFFLLCEDCHRKPD